MATKEYHQEYYVDNRERLRRYRKKRYHKNRSYRKGISYRKSVYDILNRSSRYPIVAHDGKSEPAYPISVCTAQNRWVLYIWAKEEVIPKALYHDTKGNSVYSLSQLLLIEWVSGHFSGRITKDDLRNILSRWWTKTYNTNLMKEVLTAYENPTKSKEIG